MKIAFFSNFINHHQVYLADELYKLTDANYKFISTEPMPHSFIVNGYPDFSNREYIIKSFESATAYSEALKIANNYDVVIIGSAPEIFVADRIKNNKLTFRYSERWFKTGYIHLFSPRVIRNLYKYHIKYRNKELYMLAASAYMANDARLTFSYPNKCFKWGYFTHVERLDIDKILSSKNSKFVHIIWCARLISLKHPEMIPLLAYRLVKNGIRNFEIKMVGSGYLMNDLKKQISQLEVEKYVKLCGSIPNEEVIKLYRSSNVFLFTSDKQEGWGAVLNEAMSNGCAVIASNEIGSVPFLIKNKQNGLIFKSRDCQSLYENVKFLIDNTNAIEIYAKNAYKNMADLWSPENAAKQFINLANGILKGSDNYPSEGPCSVAKPIFKKNRLI